MHPVSWICVGAAIVIGIELIIVVCLAWSAGVASQGNPPRRNR